VNSNATRGAVLVGIAALVAALILGWGVDDSDANLVAAVPTVTPVPTVDVTTFPTATPVPQAPAGAPRSPEEVRVQVANAAEIQGKAGDMTARLSAQGYRTSEPANAEASSVSTVYFELGYEADAQAVLAIFGSPNTQTFPMPNPRPEVSNPDTLDGGPNIIMIVGSDELSRG